MKGVRCELVMKNKRGNELRNKNRVEEGKELIRLKQSDSSLKKNKIGVTACIHIYYYNYELIYK